MSCCVCGLNKLDLEYLGKRYFVFPLANNDGTQVNKFCEECFSNFVSSLVKFNFSKGDTSESLISGTPFHSNYHSCLIEALQFKKHLDTIQFRYIASDIPVYEVDLVDSFAYYAFHFSQFGDVVRLHFRQDFLQNYAKKLSIYEYAPLMEFGPPKKFKSNWGFNVVTQGFGLSFTNSNS